MKKIAVEEHFHTKAFVDYLHSRRAWPRREFVERGGKRFIKDWWSETGYRLIDADQPDPLIDMGEGRLKLMDDAGIDMQVLSLSFPGVEMFDAEEGTDMARSVNDELSGVVRRYPDRFAGFAALAPQNPHAAADELQRAVEILGLKGAMINGHIRGEYLDDRKYRVLLERAEKLDVPIYIHPKMPSPDMIKPYLAYPGLASAMLGFSAEASLHAMRLILSGVFDEYPGLKVILGHLGEALPFWLWRLDSRFVEEKRDPASAAFYRNFGKSPAQCFRENFYVTVSGMFWQPVLKFVSSVLGSDRIMFAADYPYESSEEAAQFMDSVEVDDVDREKICHANAERILKL
jgi:predicted TIM-barrel fold metal-dependent hydrolase